MGFIDQWIYYEPVRRRPKYHLFVAGDNTSACERAGRADERATRTPTIKNTNPNRCLLCKRYARRNGIDT